jgi:putative GTP pyrophosphokinase
MPSENINQAAEAELQELGITAEELADIQRDLVSKTESYREDAEYVTNKLLRVAGAHSVRYRVKNPDGLVKKILRKKRENKKRVITLDTYEREMTDLAGIRVLHLFKGDWQLVHDYIKKTWKLKEKPIAYYREGDADKLLEMYTAQSCRVKKHPSGYRSVHYVIEMSSSMVKRYIEIQVRTIFEEGWSEVDHKIRYPDFSDNPLTNSLLLMLNRIAGSADEMSEFVKELNSYILSAEQQYQKIEAEKLRMEVDKNEKISKLEAIIANGKLSREEEDTLKNIANSLQHDADYKQKFQKERESNKALALGIELGRFAGGDNFISDIVRAAFIKSELSRLMKENTQLRNNLELVNGRLTIKNTDSSQPTNSEPIPDSNKSI